MKAENFFVTGIGTDVGKTVVSAVFAEALGADYWKPVQAGVEDGTDARTVGQLAGPGITIHPERYRLEAPMSPHAAAARESRSIRLADFKLPETDRPLVVEGAGGMLVPLNDEDTVLDLMKQLGIPVVLVSRHYLGSINHSLMSLDLLKGHGLELAHLVFIGHNPETESVIEKISGVRATIKIPEAERVDRKFVQQQAERLRRLLKG